MNAIYAANFFVVPTSQCGYSSHVKRFERHKDDEKDIVAEGYDREKGIAFVVK